MRGTPLAAAVLVVGITAGCGSSPATTGEVFAVASNPVTTAVPPAPAATDGPEPTPRATTRGTTRPTRPGTTRPPTTTTVHDAKDIRVVGMGVSPVMGTEPMFSWAYVLENTSSTLAYEFVTVDLAFLDADGVVVETEDSIFGLILPGQTVAMGNRLEAEGVVSMTVTVKVDDEGRPTDMEPNVTATDASFVPDDRGGTITATVRSSSGSATKNYKVVSVFYDEDGAILGGDFDYPPEIPPMATQVITMSLSFDPPAGFDHVEAVAFDHDQDLP